MKKKFVTTWAFAFWTTSAIAVAPCQVWWSQVLWNCRYIFFDSSRDITVAIKLKGHVTLKVWLSHGKSTHWLVFYPQVFCKCRYNVFNLMNFLSASITKWSNTLKQFMGKLPTNCLSVFGHFVGLALKGLRIHAHLWIGAPLDISPPWQVYWT